MKTPLAEVVLFLRCELADAELADRIERDGRLLDPKLRGLFGAMELARRETSLDLDCLCRLELSAATRREEIETEVLARHQLTAAQYLDWLNVKLWHAIGEPTINDPTLLKRLRATRDDG